MPPHVRESVHKALSSDIRREILLELRDGSKYLSEIAEAVDKKPQTVDFHIDKLADAGLVEGERREGKKYYSLAAREIVKFLEEGEPLPPEHHPKPPHEIVRDAMEQFSERLERIEERLDRIEEKL